MTEKYIRNFIETKNIYLKESDSIKDAACLMVEFHLERIPVLKNGKFIGMVSYTDVLHALLEELKELKKTDLNCQAEGRVIAHIS